MKLLERFLEILVLGSLIAAVFVVFYQVGNFLDLVARLLGVNLF